MPVLVFILAGLLIIAGMAGYIIGLDMLPTERGMTGVISGTIAFVGGILGVMLGFMLQRLERMAVSLATLSHGGGFQSSPQSESPAPVTQVASAPLDMPLPESEPTLVTVAPTSPPPASAPKVPFALPEIATAGSWEKPASETPSQVTASFEKPTRVAPKMPTAGGLLKKIGIGAAGAAAAGAAGTILSRSGGFFSKKTQSEIEPAAVVEELPLPASITAEEDIHALNAALEEGPVARVRDTEEIITEMLTASNDPGLHAPTPMPQDEEVPEEVASDETVEDVETSAFSHAQQADESPEEQRHPEGSPEEPSRPDPMANLEAELDRLIPLRPKSRRKQLEEAAPHHESTPVPEASEVTAEPPRTEEELIAEIEREDGPLSVSVPMERTHSSAQDHAHDEQEIVGSYDSGGIKYTMYANGSVLAESDAGRMSFGSLEELRQFIDSGSL